MWSYAVNADIFCIFAENFNATMMKKSIIITGGAGFIGSHNALELLTNEYDIVIGNKVEKLRFKAIPFDNNSKVKIVGNKNLKSGSIIKS